MRAHDPANNRGFDSFDRCIPCSDGMQTALCRPASCLPVVRTFRYGAGRGRFYPWTSNRLHTPAKMKALAVKTDWKRRLWKDRSSVLRRSGGTHGADTDPEVL